MYFLCCCRASRFTSQSRQSSQLSQSSSPQFLSKLLGIWLVLERVLEEYWIDERDIVQSIYKWIFKLNLRIEREKRSATRNLVRITLPLTNGDVNERSVAVRKQIIECDLFEALTSTDVYIISVFTGPWRLDLGYFYGKWFSKTITRHLNMNQKILPAIFPSPFLSIYRKISMDEIF